MNWVNPNDFQYIQKINSAFQISINHLLFLMNLVNKSISLLFICFITQCSSPNEELPSNTIVIKTDQELFDLVNNTTEWTYWAYSQDTLLKGNGSGHIENKLQTRYNSFASASLDESGTVKAGIQFQEGSLIVKDLFIDSKLNTIAVMYKNAESPHKADNDWVWGYFAPDGSIRSEISTGARNCQYCHAPGIDFTLMNAAHKK